MIVIHLGEQIDSTVQVKLNILYIHNDNQQLYNPLIDVNLKSSF